MNCPYCDSNITIKYGTKRLKDGSIFKTYWCKTGNKRYTERTGSPMTRLRSPTATLLLALKRQTEGKGYPG